MSKVSFVSFFCQVWNQPLLEGITVPFIGKWYFETKIWSAGVLIELDLAKKYEISVMCLH